MSQKAWVVHKFGGTSVASAERYRKVAEIMGGEPGERKAIVVSAMAGVTDRLHELVELARKQEIPAVAERLAALHRAHLETARELLKGAPLSAFESRLEADIGAIRDLLKAIQLSRTCSELTLELIAGHGELWSAQLLCGYLQGEGRPSSWLDARLVLVVTPGETGPVVDWKISRGKLDGWLSERKQSPWLVITGYVASTPEGISTTLKRNGSDFSASIFGKLLEASSVTIWTDVDGVLSADPRKVPEAVVLDEMSYQEAVELAYFGAKVLHPHTMAPAFEMGIPIWIRNTLRPGAPGTRIHERKAEDPRASLRPVKGFSTMDKTCLINLEGTGMIGVPGVASRLFGALREVGVSVIMISQASSEHSICFAVPEAQGELARATVTRAFAAEIQQGQIQSASALPGCTVLAAVGDGMVEVPGVAAKLFRALAKAGVSVRAIAQGSSERNISVVIDQKDSTRALRAAHAGFYLSAQTLSVGVIGPGLIGQALLRQLAAQAPKLRSQFNIDLRVRGIMSSGKMLLSDGPIPLDEWKGLFGSQATPPDAEAFARHIQAEHLPHAAIIDCTSSEEVASRYVGWLERGIHVVTPNKKAGSGRLPSYLRLRELGPKAHSHYLYEATVGAGLPVITTLRDLIQTGDEIVSIEGVLSGTLSFIFNTFNEKTPFSETVREARKLGYTEPDPRDDLSGMDVARKLIILGREMGLGLELSDIAVQSLVPAPLRAVPSAEAFLDGLPAFDPPIEQLRASAAAAGEVLRYVGVVGQGGKASVELKRYPASHPFARIGGTDNIFAFTTARYRTQPLIVQGPGAGPEVTAGGVFADLLRLAAFIGAPL